MRPGPFLLPTGGAGAAYSMRLPLTPICPLMRMK